MHACHIKGEQMVTLDPRGNSYLSHRALKIFELDFLLYNFRNEVDPHRVFIRGHSSLSSYLIVRKNYHTFNAASTSITDVIAMVSQECRELTGMGEIKEYLSDSANDSFKFRIAFPPSLALNYPILTWAEWDSGLWDRVLLK